MNKNTVTSSVEHFVIHRFNFKIAKKNGLRFRLKPFLLIFLEVLDEIL